MLPRIQDFNQPFNDHNYVNFSLTQVVEAFSFVALYGGGQSAGGQRRETDTCKYSDVSVFELCMHGLNKEIDQEKSTQVLVFSSHTNTHTHTKYGLTCACA